MSDRVCQPAVGEGRTVTVVDCFHKMDDKIVHVSNGVTRTRHNVVSPDPTQSQA